MQRICPVSKSEPGAFAPAPALESESLALGGDKVMAMCGAEAGPNLSALCHRPGPHFLSLHKHIPL